MDNVLADAEVEPGTLLVAAPTMFDANFRRTVVFVIDHRDEGTLGVVLNRPSDVPVDDVLPPTAVVDVVLVVPLDTLVPLLESNDFAIRKMPSAAATMTNAMPRKLALSAPRPRGPSGSRGGRRMLMALP